MEELSTDTANLFQRRGCFYVDGQLLRRKPEVLLRILKDVAVLRVEGYVDADRARYYACSPHFDPIDDGRLPPVYEAVINDETDTVTWTRLEE